MHGGPKSYHIIPGGRASGEEVRVGEGRGSAPARRGPALRKGRWPCNPELSGSRRVGVLLLPKDQGHSAPLSLESFKLQKEGPQHRRRQGAGDRTVTVLWGRTFYCKTGDSLPLEKELPQGQGSSSVHLPFGSPEPFSAVRLGRAKRPSLPCVRHPPALPNLAPHVA